MAEFNSHHDSRHFSPVNMENNIEGVSNSVRGAVRISVDNCRRELRLLLRADPPSVVARLVREGSARGGGGISALRVDRRSAAEQQKSRYNRCQLAPSRAVG